MYRGFRRYVCHSNLRDLMEIILIILLDFAFDSSFRRRGVQAVGKSTFSRFIRYVFWTTYLLQILISFESLLRSPSNIMAKK